MVATGKSIKEIVTVELPESKTEMILNLQNEKFVCNMNDIYILPCCT